MALSGVVRMELMKARAIKDPSTGTISMFDGGLNYLPAYAIYPEVNRFYNAGLTAQQKQRAIDVKKRILEMKPAPRFAASGQPVWSSPVADSALNILGEVDLT